MLGLTAEAYAQVQAPQGQNASSPAQPAVSSADIGLVRDGEIQYVPDFELEFGLPIATPEFAERWLTGRPLVDALGEAPMVIFNPKDMLQHRLIRQLTRRRLEPPAHSIPAPGAFSRSIRLGLGWGMLEEEAVVDDLAAGRLVEVAKGKYVEVPLYWQHWKLESAVLDALTTAVLDAAETGLRTP